MFALTKDRRPLHRGANMLEESGRDADLGDKWGAASVFIQTCYTAGTNGYFRRRCAPNPVDAIEPHQSYWNGILLGGV
jgi:hypothetical protein